MINIRDPKCVTCKLKIPSFNYVGEKKGLYCNDCKKDNMINLKHSMCITCNNNLASFNELNELHALYCSKCASPTMVNINCKKCIICKKKSPSFNKPDKKIPLYCKDCKNDTMVYVKNINNKCIKCNIKRPYYNIKSEKKGLYCNDCKEPTMINVYNNICITCNDKTASYNKLGENKALYCIDCKESTMIDILHKNCKMCNKRASYNTPGITPLYCFSHKKEGMILNPSTKCKDKGCKNIAIYGIRKQEYCDNHKRDGDINLVESICSKCGLMDIVINGLCINICSVSDKITLEMKKYKKVKEKRILRILTESYKTPSEYNKRVDYTCGKRNSEEKEIGYDYNTHKVYVEIDENQHKSYCELGEINRMKNIFMSDGGQKIVFLRYNPDNYYVNGKKNKISQLIRETSLIKWLHYYEKIENVPDMLSVQYLYYNDNNQKNYKIDPYETTIEYKCDTCNKIFYVEDMYKEHKEKIC